MALIWLEVDLDEVDDKLAFDLRDCMASHPGTVPLVMLVTGDEMFIASVDEALWVDGSQECLNQLKGLIGEEAVAIVSGLDAVS